MFCDESFKSFYENFSGCENGRHVTKSDAVVLDHNHHIVAVTEQLTVHGEPLASHAAMRRRARAGHGDSNLPH